MNGSKVVGFQWLRRLWWWLPGQLLLRAADFINSCSVATQFYSIIWYINGTSSKVSALKLDYNAFEGPNLKTKITREMHAQVYRKD